MCVQLGVLYGNRHMTRADAPARTKLILYAVE